VLIEADLRNHLKLITLKDHITDAEVTPIIRDLDRLTRFGLIRKQQNFDENGK
jgi:hypothetical protein